MILKGTTNGHTYQLETVAESKIKITLGEITKTFPVLKKSGYCFKANRHSISCDSGNAEKLLEFFSEWPGNCYLPAVVRKLMGAQ